MSQNTLNTLKEFPLAGGQTGQFYSLPALGKEIGHNLGRKIAKALVTGHDRLGDLATKCTKEIDPLALAGIVGIKMADSTVDLREAIDIKNPQSTGGREAAHNNPGADRCPDL